jgi:EAL domain-containing protein (putative c-di-GMP-specific phosphodiesterase class I)
VLRLLDAQGLHASLDDFGTGYSSLTYLRQLPLQELKVDASFVRTMADSAPDRTIVQSTIELGHRLGLVVIAEGVEDQATFDLLRGLECDQAQGYLFSRPLPGAALAAWVHARQSPG